MNTETPKCDNCSSEPFPKEMRQPIESFVETRLICIMADGKAVVTPVESHDDPLDLDGVIMYTFVDNLFVEYGDGKPLQKQIMGRKTFPIATYPRTSSRSRMVLEGLPGMLSAMIGDQIEELLADVVDMSDYYVEVPMEGGTKQRLHFDQDSGDRITTNWSTTEAAAAPMFALDDEEATSESDDADSDCEPVGAGVGNEGEAE